MAKLSDVAKAAGVSSSVASRVLSGDPKARVSPVTRARVRRVADELGYQPDHHARALRSRRAAALALAIPDVTNAIFAEMFRGVREACDEHGVAVLLADAGSLIDSPHSSLSNLVTNGRVDGVLLQRPDTCSDAELEAALRPTTPAVLINSSLGEVRPGSVVLDDASGVMTAVQHLVELGHSSIGFVGGRLAHDTAARRLKSYLGSMSVLGLETRPEWIIEAGWEAHDGQGAMEKLAAQNRLPTAILAASANSAVGVLAAATRLGIGVPDRLSIVGINTSWVSDSTAPPLTTVRMPLYELGRAATGMLLDHLEGSPLSNVTVVSPRPRLILRDSTKRLTPRTS